MVAQHGPGMDGFIQDAVNRIDAELARLGKPHEFHRYNDAGHAFQNFLDAARYRSRPARGSWSEMLAFFAQYLRTDT